MLLMTVDVVLRGQEGRCPRRPDYVRRPTSLIGDDVHGIVPNDERLLARLRENYDGLHASQLEVVDRTDWTNDRYALGSYSQFGGSLSTRDTLEEIWGQTPTNLNRTVALAGEWASPEPYVQSHMEGALLSGERAARDVVKKLQEGD